MEIRGICSICGKPAKIHTCSLCGGLVCSSCYISKQGICKKCQKGIKFGKNLR